jgi:ribonucleotide reductase alpha subunit
MWDADGCYLTNGAVAFDFTNYQLSQGVWRLCRSLGYRPVFGGGRVQPLGTAPCWRVSLPAYDAERFEKKEIAASLATATGVIEVNEQTFYRVASIEDIPFYGKVYNLQVKDDETYCVEGVVVHNCYISAVKDQLVGEGSIFDFMQREARLFSQGSGSGANLSDIRAEGEALSAGGSTSGVLSFMKVLDAAAGAIKSGGATRRAAKMVILDADHPEIENYIWAKAKEERKAAILIAGGVEGGYEGDAVQTVAFQNANHSVRITKGFMQALADDAPWPLINRVNGLVNKTISAVQLWREIAEAAWECADPGVQFDEILNDWNTVADTERVRGTNPCFPGSARVHTDRGLLTFKELHALYLANEPFRVYTHNETNQDSPSSALSLSTPEAFAVTGINEIIALTFSNGAELRCTPSHRIFTTNRGFVEAQDLTKDDQVKLIDAPTPAESDDLAADFFHLGVAPEVLHVANNEPLCTLPAEWTKEIATLVGWLTLSYDASTDHESLFSEFLASGLDCPWSLEEFNEVAKHLLRRETPGHIAPEVFQLAPTLLRAYLRGLYVSLSETDVLDTSAVLLVDLPRTLLADIQLLLSSLAISSSLLLKSPILSAKETDLDSLFSDNPPSEPTTVTCLATRRLEPELTYNLSEPLNHSYVVDAVVVANCSEYTHVDDTACNLASINLVKFFENGQFNVDDFEYAARLWTITLEITVSMSHYPAAVIAKKSFEHRTLGLGYANLGALLMRAGLAYDSPEARAAMGAITALMHNRAYATSAELAAAVGPCTAYGDNKTSMARVLHNHRRAAYGSEADALEPYDALTIEPQVLDHQLLARTPFAALSGPVKAAADSALSGIDAAGYRNMQVTVLAPTGCLVGDSQITTSNGLVGLNSLGDENGTTYQALDLDLRVLTDEGSRRVSQFYVNGYANIVEVTTDHGRTLRGTPEHRIRVVDRRGQWYWKRLAEITSGDIVPVAPGLVGAPCTIELPACDGAYTPSTLTAALAELVGRYQARGYENLHTGLFYPLDTLRFAIPDKEVASVHAINALLLEVFKRTGAPENRADGPAIALSDLDLTIWWQTTLDTAPYVDEVPAIILRTNDPLIYGSYVRGLLEADAKFSKAITKTFSCAAAAQQFLALLTTLNVRARITSNPRKIKIPASSSKALTRAIRRRVYYPRIHATRSIVSRQTPRAPLYRSLPLTGKWADVRARAREVAKNEWVPLSPPEILRLRPLSYVDATDLDAARGATEAARHITSPVLVPRHLAEKLYALTLDTQLLHTLRFFYDLISTDAVEAGSDLTYDLVVPDSVTYVANGLVSHNTIGLVMSCDTTGVEPDFALVKMKKLAGGGYMRIINSSVPAALSTLGYSKEEQDRCMTYALGTQTFFADTPVSASTLQVAGATLDEIELAQGYLAGVSDITWAFEPHVVGTALYARAGLDEDATGKDLLRALGFNDAQIESSSLEICGRLTLEGSPDIRPEHLAVFDCAVECGNGTRSIAWSGHVGALSAVAPHISGSVSKTVNLPNTATVADIENAHLTAYQSGVKCIAIYRDGSKVAQPLSSATSSELSEALDVAGAWAPKPLTEGMSPTEYYEGHSIPRFRPPNPRFGPQWSITIGGEKIYIRASSYADGTPAEVFIDWGGQGSVVRGMASALSIAISHALQRGTPLEDIIKAFRNQVFEPRGIVSGHANLKMADSVPDALARILGHFYLNRNDLVQVPGPAPTMGHAGGATVRELTSTVSPSSDEVDKAKLIVAKGEGKRVYGLRCSSCGSSNLIQAGSCHVCGECGETTGCS